MSPNSPQCAHAWAVAALAGLHVLPARALILPCVGALPATIIALRRPAWGPVALACALPALAFFFAFDGSRLGPIAAALAAFALWPLARRNAGLLELAATQVLMVWLAFWVTLGCRASGLDFQYFFAWLSPGADPKDTWAANALMTISKYLILPVLGIVLARRRAGDALIQAASGMLVPAATMVSPMTRSLTPMAFAKPTAESTSHRVPRD